MSYEEAPIHNDQESVIGATAKDTNEASYITIGRTRVPIEDVLTAYAGTLNPGIAAPSSHKFANPTPVGLGGFAMTTFCLSIANFQGFGIKLPNAIVPLAIFYGGLTQLLAGMWEIAVENTFGAVALAGYGSFWLSWACINIPWFGVAQAYAAVEDGPRMMQKFVGFYLLAWCIFTIGLCICTVKSTLAFFSMFFLLWITFLLLAIGELCPSVGATKAGGIVGIIVGIIVGVIAWYNTFAGVATKENSYITVRPIYLPGSAHFTRFKSA